MDIKELKGSLTITDFADALVASTKSKSFGALWEKCVSCNGCKYRETCQAVADKLDDEGINISCSEFIDLLLGDLDLEDLAINF